jgi:DNA-binding transcriptional MerR regulator
MKSLTISKLAKEFGISRSALLHYDSIGLLKPLARSASGYRLYAEDARERLKRIVAYREAGLPLAEISKLLSRKADARQEALLRRLEEVNGEIARLRAQRQIVLAMLKGENENSDAKLCHREVFVKALRDAGLGEEEMRRFHEALERAEPTAHHDFLALLGFDESQIAQIRKSAKR